MVYGQGHHGQIGRRRRRPTVQRWPRKIFPNGAKVHGRRQHRSMLLRLQPKRIDELDHPGKNPRPDGPARHQKTNHGIDKNGIFNPSIIVDRHISCMGLPFLKCVKNDKHRWDAGLCCLYGMNKTQAKRRLQMHTRQVHQNPLQLQSKERAQPTSRFRDGRNTNNRQDGL